MKIRCTSTLLLAIYFAIWSIPAFCQTPAIDSLQKLLTQKGLADTMRLNTLLSLGERLSYTDINASEHYLQLGFQLAQKLQLNNKMGEAMAYRGTNFYYLDKADSALYYFQKSIHYFELDTSLDAKVSKSTIQAEIGDIEVGRGNFEAGVAIYLRSVDTLIKYDPHNYNAIGNSYLAISTVYNKMLQLDKALAYSTKALAALQKDPTKPIAMAYGQLAVSHDLMKLRRFSLAHQHLRAAEAVADKVRSKALYARLYGGYGELYDAEKKGDSAIMAYKKTIAYAIGEGGEYYQMLALEQIGLIYTDSVHQQFGLSAQYLKQALALAQKLGNKHKEMKLLRDMATVASKNHKNEAAVAYYKAYLSLSDSLNEQQTLAKINELETRYQTQKKEDSLLVMHKNAQVRTLQLKKKQTQNIALIVGCGLLILLSGAAYINFKRKNQLLQQSEKLHAQQIRELEKQQELLAMQSVIKGQEAERSRLAKDLHDGVGGLLSGVKLSLSTMKGNVILTEKSAQSLGSVIEQLDQSIAELRRVSHNMMPEALIKFGLKEALENYSEHINQSGQLKVQCQIFGMEVRMEQNTEIVLYRMVQELLSNILKHAEAKNVLIQLMRKGAQFSLTVEDDGKGFELEKISKTGAGLANVRARAEYLGGTVDIHTSLGAGTSITVEGHAA